MHIDGARADPEAAADSLACLAIGNPCQDFAFPSRQQLGSRKVYWQRITAGLALGTWRQIGNELAHTKCDRLRFERLFDEIHGAMLDSIDSRRNSTLARNHDDGRGIIVSLKLL